jgi:hypothetical protein
MGPLAEKASALAKARVQKQAMRSRNWAATGVTSRRDRGLNHDKLISDFYTLTG